jgi:hypothetical protein
MSSGLFEGCVTVPEGQDQPNLHADFQSSGKVPGAKGEVTVSSTAMNTNSIEIEIKNLVRPQRLNRGAQNYVVWESFTGAETKPQSVGALNLDKKFTGRLKTATPFRSFNLFITAESNVIKPLPTGQKLFWVTINH